MANQEYHTILVPIDGSPEAELAFDKAKQSAQLNHAHLDLLTVLDTNQFIGNYGAGLTGDAIYQLSLDAEQYLNTLAQQAQAEGLTDVSVHVRFGNPKNVIAKDFPQDHGTDLIMIGATGMNALVRMFIGSVTEYVNQHAPCDVLIVRTDLDNKRSTAKR